MAYIASKVAPAIVIAGMTRKARLWSPANIKKINLTAMLSRLHF